MAALNPPINPSILTIFIVYTVSLIFLKSYGKFIFHPHTYLFRQQLKHEIDCAIRPFNCLYPSGSFIYIVRKHPAIKN